MKKGALFGAALLFLLGSFYFFTSETSSTPEEEENAESNKTIELTDEQIGRGDFRFYPVKEEQLIIKLPVYGKITIPESQKAHISLRTKGIVKDAKKNIGDRIQKGETLAILESKELAESKSDYLRSLARLNLQKRLYENEKNLFSKKLGKEQELYQSENAFLEAEIEKNLFERKLALFGLKNEEIENIQGEPYESLSLFEVKAPFDATILKRDITVGEALQEGIDIYELADLSTLYLNLAIYPKDSESIKIGQKLTFEDINGKKGVATIQKISPVLDEQNGKLLALATLENKNNIWIPGTPVTAEITTHTFHAQTCVPKEAVVSIEETPYVFIVNGNQFQLREVSLGLKDEQFAHLISGVSPGEEVVSKNAVLLKCELTKQEPD